MQETTEQPTITSEEASGLTAAALRAGAWADEALLRPDEDAAQVLAPGTARRRALEEALRELSPEEDPGAVRRYRFRHPTASGKTIAAAGFVDAARTVGVLILTHRRLLVSQFNRELKAEGYGGRFPRGILRRTKTSKKKPITIQTYAWFARHVDDLDREAYQLV